jgi:hypothetical protein
MSKEPDFGSDLAALNEHVNVEVGDMLKALKQKRAASGQANLKRIEEQAGGQTTSDVSAVSSENRVKGNSQRRQRSAIRSRLIPVIERDEALENVTTRLRGTTNELLTEAALRQRLKKEHPSTRQDIIEVALQEWFRKHGYRPGGSSDE